MMKTTRKIALTVAAVMAFTLTQSIQADEVLRSPKLQLLQTKTVKGTAKDPDLAHPGKPKIYTSPKMAANLPRTTVRSAAKDPDLAHLRTRIMLSGKSYVREMQAKQLKALGIEQFELAPLK